MPSTIYIDSSVGSNDLNTYAPLDTLPCEVVSFESMSLGGDVMFTGNGPPTSTNNTPIIMIGIEVKSLDDLIQSLQSNRLTSHQIPGMIASGYHANYLIYYGRYRPSPKPVPGKHTSYYALQVHKGLRKGNRPSSKPSEIWHTLNHGGGPYVYTRLQRALTEIAQAGITIIPCNDKREVAIIIGEVLYPWWSKPWSEHDLFNCFNLADNKPPRGGILLPDIPRDVMQRANIAKTLLRNIGWKRALAAGYYFTAGVGDMLTCYDVSRWAGIDGYGRVIAKAVVDILLEGIDIVSSSRAEFQLLRARQQRISRQLDELKP